MGHASESGKTMTMTQKEVMQAAADAYSKGGAMAVVDVFLAAAAKEKAVIEAGRRFIEQCQTAGEEPARGGTELRRLAPAYEAGRQRSWIRGARATPGAEAPQTAADQ